MNAKSIKILILTILVGTTGIAQKYINKENTNVVKEWKGISFSSTKTIFENIENSADFSMLKTALKNKEILDALKSEEMVTVFAITNNGFEKYKEKQDSIFSSSNAENLKAILKYHFIPGRVDSHSIKKSIERNGGTIYYATLQGEKLGIKEENGQLMLVDSKGNTSLILATDFYHKNGFFHITEGIVFPTN
ncbi:MAG: fasciclin domain-containing protein [Flavobacteriaceae bacterium]